MPRDAMSSVVFLLVGFEDFAKGIETHQASVFTLSFVIAAFSSFLMWVAYRRIRSEKWMKYFACSFCLLSLQYLWLLSIWFATSHPNNASSPSSSIANNFFVFLIFELLSIANNLFAVAAAQNIENKKPLFSRLCWLLLVGSVVTTLLGYASQAEPVGRLLPYAYKSHVVFYEVLGRSFASLFSAYCLFLVGFAIFANLSVRRHLWLALGGVFMGAIYAVVQITYGLSPFLAQYFITVGEFPDKLRLFDSFLRGIALPLKIALFAFTYLLVMRFFETLNEVRKLQDSGIDARQDYLSTEGVLRLIGEKLGDNIPAMRRNNNRARERSFVNLVIRVPGDKNRRVACVLWPNDDKEKRTRILDWPEPTKFSPVGGEEWEEALYFSGLTLTDERRKEIVWPTYAADDQIYDVYEGNARSIVTVAVEAHGAVIACLQVARYKSLFSQMAIRQIREIANLISPAVQANRELAALDNMSIRFAEKQAEEGTYSTEKAANIIADTLYDVFSPNTTQLQIDFGFSNLNPIYRTKPHHQHAEEQLKKEIRGKKYEAFPTTFVDEGIVSHRLLKKQLTARVRETLSTSASETTIPDRLIMGHLLLAVNESTDNYNQPALGTTYLHRKTASTLAGDAYLDFARDYYNDLLKRLGKDLSRKSVDVERWFELIKNTLKGAGLSWVVAGNITGRGELGDEEGLYTLRNLDEFGTKGIRVDVGEVGIVPYKLRGTESSAKNLLEVTLQSSEWYIWLGVNRAGFGPELEFSSPWRTFLVNLAQIADAALSRITLPERFQLNLEAAQLQGIISAVVTTGTIIHQLSNMIQGQSSSSSHLLEALKLKKLTTDDENLEKIMYAMQSSAERMQDLFQSFTRLTNIDEHRPCRLKEAAYHAYKLFEVSLVRRRIEFDVDIPSSISIDVSFSVAALALANLVGNAKDAVDRDGRICIEAEKDGDSVLCRVIDNGRGVPPDVRDHIFEARVTTKDTGTGLGLYLTYHSLNENGSSIELTKSDKTGSVFTIRFPLSKKEA